MIGSQAEENPMDDAFRNRIEAVAVDALLHRIKATADAAAGLEDLNRVRRFATVNSRFG